MSYDYQSKVSKNSITREEFLSKLNEELKGLSQGKQEKYKEKAMTIFDKFAGLNGNDTLEEDEQIQAFAALEALDTDSDGDVSRRELKKGKNGSEGQRVLAEQGYKATKHFMDTFEHIDSAKGEVQYGELDEKGEQDITVHYDNDTTQYNDDEVTRYHLDNDNRIVEKDEIKEDATYVHKGTEEEPYNISNEVSKKTTEEAILDESKKSKSKPVQNKTFNSDQVQAGFFQYITQDKDFTGELLNGEKMALPDGCKLVEGGIEFQGKVYKMRGDDNEILRFECDENKKTLREALSESESTDKVHKYHNHGDKVNSKSSYDAQKGEITHGDDETAVSQTQTFASMVMNSAKESTLTLDNQKTNGNSTVTTGDTIVSTIDTNNDGITMQEFISYLNAAQKESATVQTPQGARKFAKGVNLDAKAWANIGKVFKKYAGADGKLDKDEVQKLLDALKKDSMTKLAEGIENEKYQGVKGEDNQSKPKDENKKSDVDNNVKYNRLRYDKRNEKQSGYGQKEWYSYHDGKRTVDDNGNVAVAGHSSLFKKRFMYINGLEKEVDAKIQEKTVDGKEKQRIVKVKDKNDNLSYYTVVTNQDGSYQLGEEVIKAKKNKYLTKTAAIKQECGFNGDFVIPDNISMVYENDKPVFKLNGGKCSKSTAEVYIIRYNSQIGKTVLTPVNNNKKKIEDNVVDLSVDKSSTQIQEVQNKDVKANGQVRTERPEPMKDQELFEQNYNPQKLSDDEKREAMNKAKALHLEPTEGADYGWYKVNDRETNQEIYFFWDKNEKKFFKMDNVKSVDADGTFSK